ncbi:MAG: tripartite tricarboxylate transporter substrate binding protein [Polaromonas sp.]|nr:tripartite tricarboxylate transporter substrate binding protein [Polaromonas sp.]
MKISSPAPSRCLLVIATATTAFSALSSQAQSYPLKPITMIVPFAPGGGTDSIARDVGKALGEKLGQVVVIDNKGGAGGSIGANDVAKAQADGYTLLFATSTFVTNAATEAAPSYSIEKDFSPIAMIGRGPLLVVASKAMDVKTIAQLRTAMAARPDGTNYCSAGNGSINHLSGELFRQKTQLAMTHVPYKGSGPATVDLLAGRIQLFFATVPTILPYVLDKRVELLAVTGAKRSQLFPDTPTMAEAGIKGFEISTWWGVLAPAKTPQPIVDKLNVAINKVAARDPLRSRLSHEGADAVSGSPSDFRKVLIAETVLWREVAQTAGLKPH